MKRVKECALFNHKPDVGDNVFVLAKKASWNSKNKTGSYGTVVKINGLSYLVEIPVPYDLVKSFGKDTSTEWVGYDRLGYV